MAGPRRPGRHRGLREAAPSGYKADEAGSRAAGVLLDSDVVIDVLRGRPAATKAFEALIRQGVPTHITPVTWAEIFAGVRPEEHSDTEAFLERRSEVFLDAAIGRRAGVYLSRYRASHGLALGDALIAAAAVGTGLALWTLNRRHYPMPGIVFHEGGG